MTPDPTRPTQDSARKSGACQTSAAVSVAPRPLAGLPQTLGRTHLGLTMSPGPLATPTGERLAEQQPAAGRTETARKNALKLT